MYMALIDKYIHIPYILTSCSYAKTACDRLNNDPKDVHILMP